ncbi:MAG: hypothetical protein HY040_22970 [Planctomycetes bacterium]|nr:hypothetical protein [Planctomycetota bacterium]
MHGPSWIALLRRIPVQYHDSLAFSLVTGGEIVVQTLLRLEREFLIMRGRMAGSTDVGRVVILPYSQIITLAFQRRMAEPEVQAIFGQAFDIPVTAEAAAAAPPEESGALDIGPVGPATPASAAAADTLPGNANTPLPPGSAETPAEPSAAGADKAKNKLPSKSMLLARLRARLAEQGK